jgi:hypothetical protein
MKKAYEQPLSLEDIYKSKANYRKKRAQEPFESKLRALVRMQGMQYSMTIAAGKTPNRKPWHYDRIRQD